MSFERIIGQDSAVAALRNRVEAASVPHALLFSGPSGVGKKTAALELAKILLCEKESGRPCGACGSCGKVERLSHPDLVVVSPSESGQMGIAEIRGLIGRVQLKPFGGVSQVAVLDGAESMTDEAQNAFLKVLEEPPQGAYFVLVASDTGRLYATVLSRCQKISFRGLAPDEVEEVLLRLPELRPGEAARLAGRSAHSVESALKRRDIDAATIENGVFGLIIGAARGDITELADRGKVKREEALFETDTAACLFRDLYILKSAPKSAAGRLYFADRRAELDEIAGRYTLDAIEAALEAAADAREGLLRSANARLVFADLWMRCGVRFFNP